MLFFTYTASSIIWNMYESSTLLALPANRAATTTNLFIVGSRAGS